MARSGVGRLGTVVGTVSTWSLNQREGAARSSNLATASARPLVTLCTIYVSLQQQHLLPAAAAASASPTQFAAAAPSTIIER